MYANKVNGRAGAGEFLGRDMDFYTVVFADNDIRSVAGGGNAASQHRLNRVIEIISMNGQPVILGSPTLAGGNSTMKFAIEHSMAWEGVSNQLRDALIAHQGAYQPDGSTALWTNALAASSTGAVTVTRSATI